MGLVCSITFPMEYLPNAVHWLGEIMPLTHGVDAFRQMFIEGNTVFTIMEEIGKMTMLGFVYLTFGMISIRKMEKVIAEKNFG